MPKTKDKRKYGVILATPFSSPRKSEDLNRFSKMPVNDISATDAILLLWCPSKRMHDALFLITEWDFRYRDVFARSSDERPEKRLLMGVFDMLIISTHKALPDDQAFEMTDFLLREIDRVKDLGNPALCISEKLFPKRRKLQLFSRKHEHGWDCIPE